MDVYLPLMATAASLLLISLANTCHGDVLFSTLPHTLVVSASPVEGQVLKAGEDVITLTWGLNQSFAEGTDAAYDQVKLKLCYAPVSQVDRGWRRTEDNLGKDKTCQFTIVQRGYSRNTQSFNWTIGTVVPTAVYFVRAYAYDSEGNEVAYGQTTNTLKSTNLFKIQAVSGRHLSLEVASICFSVFALLSAVGFYLVEKRNRSSSKER